MTSIPTNAVSPVTAGASPGVPATPASPTTAVVTEFPAGTQNAGPGSVISGTVVGRDNHGQTLLQTDAGVVTFRTAANLSVGAQVTLQIQIAGSQLQAVILAARAPAVLAGALSGSAALTATPPAAGATSIVQGPLVVATVIGTAASGGSVLTPASPLPPVATPRADAATATGQAGTAAAGSSSTTQVSAPPQSPPPVPSSDLKAAIAALTARGPAALPNPAPGPVSSIVTVAQTTVLPATGTVLPAATSIPSAAAAAASVPVVTDATIVAASGPAPAARPAAAAAASYTALTANSPVYGPAAQSPTGSMQTASLSASGRPGGGPEASATTPAALPAAPTGAQLHMRYIGPVASPVVAGALVATVVAQTASGQTILDTALGRVALTLPAGVGERAAGSLLSFDVVSVTRPAVTGAPESPLGARSLAVGREWSALKAVMAAISDADAPLARQILDVGLPRPGHPRFLGQVLSFIASTSPDTRSLLGDAALASLERAGRMDLVQRLDSDLREAARANAASTDWRMFFVPVLDTHEMRQLRLFTRRRSSGRDGERDGGARFVVEVDFEEIGPLQIDGLIQKPRIDLILRSHAELPREMQAGIADVFEKTCGVSGLNGQIFFQATASFPVSPMEEMAKDARPGVDV